MSVHFLFHSFFIFFSFLLCQQTYLSKTSRGNHRQEVFDKAIDGFALVLLHQRHEIDVVHEEASFVLRNGWVFAEEVIADRGIISACGFGETGHFFGTHDNGVCCFSNFGQANGILHSLSRDLDDK